ncbi:MAG: TIGR01906 family membrane protein [Anaerolineales bacterium]|nr:TIGR01906 family membrane protein [Anaerolineales bacterium]
MSDTNHNAVARVAGGLLSLALPVLLILTSVRLLLTPAFVKLEYHLPGFPEDRFGFSQQDRLRWAPIAVDYLLNDEGIGFLGELAFSDGSAVYNPRELQHMLDVKRLTSLALAVWGGLLAAAIALGSVTAWAGGAVRLWRALRRGALWTLGLMAVLAAGIALTFSFVFVGFHQLFFAAGTWTFSYSDTLIRLFPERFWRDAFTFIALGTLAMAGLILLLASSQLARLRRA